MFLFRKSGGGGGGGVGGSGTPGRLAKWVDSTTLGNFPIGSANQILGVNSGATGLEYKNITSLLSAGSGISITGTEIATISNTGILSLTAGPGISISSGQNPTISNIGVLSLNSLTGEITLQGTTNQITITHGVGSITLSTPQDIAPSSSPTFTGLTLSGLTQGSILFAGSGGLVSQDNSNLFWDNTNKRLGIGTTTPNYKLDVGGALRLQPSSAPTLANGVIYYDNANNKFKFGEGDTWKELGGGADQHLQINTQTANYTLVLSDDGKLINMNSSSALTLTVPTNASVAFPIGTRIYVRKGGTGDVTISGASGVTINAPFGNTITTQYQTVALMKVDTDTWDLLA